MGPPLQCVVGLGAGGAGAAVANVHITARVRIVDAVESFMVMQVGDRGWQC